MADLRTALRPCEIDVTIRGITYTIPALPAADWLPAVVGEGGQTIVPGMFNAADAIDLGRRVKAGEVDPEDINTAWRDVLEAATGRSWWSAARLCAGFMHPDALPIVQGRLSSIGVDLEVVSVAALCNHLFFLMVTGATDEAELSAAKFELELPPPGELKRLDPVQASEDWLAAFDQLHELEPPS